MRLNFYFGTMCFLVLISSSLWAGGTTQIEGLTVGSGPMVPVCEQCEKLSDFSLTVIRMLAPIVEKSGNKKLQYEFQHLKLSAIITHEIYKKNLIYCDFGEDIIFQDSFLSKIERMDIHMDPGSQLKTFQLTNSQLTTYFFYGEIDGIKKLIGIDLQGDKIRNVQYFDVESLPQLGDKEIPPAVDFNLASDNSVSASLSSTAGDEKVELTIKPAESFDASDNQTSPPLSLSTISADLKYGYIDQDAKRSFIGQFTRNPKASDGEQAVAGTVVQTIDADDLSQISVGIKQGDATYLKVEGGTPDKFDVSYSQQVVGDGNNFDTRIMIFGDKTELEAGIKSASLQCGKNKDRDQSCQSQVVLENPQRQQIILDLKSAKGEQTSGTITGKSPILSPDIDGFITLGQTTSSDEQSRSGDNHILRIGVNGNGEKCRFKVVVSMETDQGKKVLAETECKL